MQILSIKAMQDTRMLLCVTIFMFCLISHMASANETYVAEVMIEGNATLDVSAFLPGIQGLIIDVATIVEAKIIAQCEIIGDETTCWCENDYIWSNLVCDNMNVCCNNPKCVANISDYTPLCVPKVFVSIFGVSADAMTQAQLEAQFKQMNGFSSLILSGQNFTVNLNSTFQTKKLQTILLSLKNNDGININVTTQGLVNMEIPPEKVCYNSTYYLNCSMEETADTCMWQITRTGQSPQTIGNGTEALLYSSCTTTTSVMLKRITLFWAGTYTCMFIQGSVTHAVSAELKVALLPEQINFTSVPPTADCSDSLTVPVNVICSIYQSTENYVVTLNGSASNVTENGIISYNKTINIECQKRQKSVFAYCEISNTVKQSRVTWLTIPIIQPGEPFCPKLDPWPKTKSGTKATILCTDPGRVGTKERMCSTGVWGDVIDLCVKEALNTLNNAAGDFEKGVGATQEIAYDIFGHLKNNTGAENTFGDIKATVSILSTMNRSSNTVTLNEALLPNFIESASNMLNTTWDSGEAGDYSLAASYLSSVEGLVNNIQLNVSEGHNASNIQLQVCRQASVCNRTVFNIEIELNSSASVVKTVGLQNMGGRLPSTSFPNPTYGDVVVSAVAENGTGPINIRLAFPPPASQRSSISDNAFHCVFWNFTEEIWSDSGCNWTYVSANISYCECDHLTSFSVLMSKTPVNLPYLDQITYIALGISICSLIVFILIECLVWNAVVKTNLSHFRHTALVNISLCLLLADCSFVLATFQNIITDTLCLILTVAQHFFYLAMFFWMLCLSVMLLHQLIFVFHPLRKKVYMILSITIGYACPTVTVGATYMYYNKKTDVSYYNRSTCWLTYASDMKGSIYAFLFPVGTIVFVNMFSMIVVIVTLLRPAAAENNKDDKEAAKSIIKAIIFLTPVFGGTWMLGLLVFVMSDNKALSVLLNYAFTIVNALQGFFILLTGCFGEKRVRDEIVKLIISNKKAKSESKKNLTSSYGK